MSGEISNSLTGNEKPEAQSFPSGYQKQVWELFPPRYTKTQWNHLNTKMQTAYTYSTYVKSATYIAISFCIGCVVLDYSLKSSNDRAVCGNYEMLKQKYPATSFEEIRTNQSHPAYKILKETDQMF